MKWSDIERSKKWETMSADQRAAAREQFFDEFVAPKAPDHFDVDDLRTRWMDQYARGEAAKQPGAEGPRSRGGDRTPMTPPQRLASYANAAVRRGVPVREVEDRLGQAFDERGYFREGEAPTSVTADQQRAWTEARAAKVDPFADMSVRARNPRGGAPMGYVSSQDEIDEAILTPDEIVAKREAAKIEELRKAAEAEGIRSPLGVAKDSLFGNIGAVADTAGSVARLANKKYRVPFGAEISAGAGLLGKLGVESAQDLSDALEAGATPRTQFLEDYARSAGNVGAAMREGQSAERKFAQAELAEAVRQGAGSTAKHAFLNPLDMAEMAGESALLMGTGKLAGTAARNVAGASAEVPGMLASEGAMSAASSSEAARNAIASASADDLAQFPDYEKLAAKYGADGARTVLAGRAGRDAAFAGAVLQALTLGATRKLSAAEEIMAGRFVAPGGRIKNTLTAGGREFLQEAPQGAAEALATNIGEASADSRKDVLAGVGPAGIIEGAAGGIIGGGLGALQKPATPAAKGVKTAEDILKSAGIGRGLVVPPVDGTSDSDLSAMLAANTLRAARDGYAADPDPDRSAAAQRAAESFGVSVEELNGADSDSGERTGGSVQADRSGAGAVPVSPDSDIGQRGGAVGVAGAELGTAKPVEELTDSAATRRDARRAETLLRAQSGQTVEQVVPQQPQVEIVQEPDSLRSRRDVARAKADFDAYLGEHGVDMAESDRRSAYDGDRVPQPEGEPVAIGPSRIAGKGVLATAPIVKPVTLFDLSADGPVRTDAGRYVNHSPTPNADVKIVQGRIVAVPNREIQAGQELTINYREIDPLREDLATRQHVPLPTAVPVQDFAKEAAADPDKNPEEFGLPKPLKERRLKRTPADFDENYDDALDYLALNGGLNRRAWASEGVDPDMLTRKAGNEWNKRFGLGPTLFPSKGGMTPSEAREKLQAAGFFPADPDNETATIEDDDAVQLVMESINQGRKFRLPAGHDVDQRRENILRMADSAAREMEIMRDGEVSPRDIVDANEFDNRERPKPVSAEAMGAEVQPEVEVLRSRIADLELELRTNEITGIPNLRAFNDDAKLGFPVVAAIDMDGLRRLNNTIGHEAADLVLRKLATILDLHKNDGARFYHRSGDEFAARFRDPTEAARTMAELQQNLETVVIRLDGAEQSYDYHGIGISYGLGEDYKHADHEANRSKAERLASGAREDSRDSNGTSRRVVPAGVQARRTGDDDGGRSAAGDVQYADQSASVDAQSSKDETSKRAPDVSGDAVRERNVSARPSGIPVGLDSRKSLATNKLSRRIAKWLGTDFAAEAIALPEPLAGALREFGRIFGREVVVFRVTEGRLNANGLRLGDNGALYVNETSQSPALTVAGHELLHEIRQSRPDLYKLIAAEVQKRANLVAWRKEMDARELTSGEHRLTDSELLEELTADGFGDAMSDPEFLTTLAERNPSKFQQFAKMALEFFDRIIKKMKRIESLGSSDYLTDIKGLRDAYAQMIADYADGVMPSESPAFEANPSPQFSQGRSGGESEKLGGLFATNGTPGGMKSVTNKAAENALQRDAQYLSDLLKRQSLRTQSTGFSGIESAVVPKMLSVLENPQVFQSVVRSIPVDVVDFFASKKLTPERVLHDESVLKNVLSVNGSTDVSLAVDEAAALVRSVAIAAAKHAGLTDRFFERDAALAAEANNTVLGAHADDRITKTKAFSNWFGDSKVVDENGEPLVVYHGTPDARGLNSTGVFKTSNEQFADFLTAEARKDVEKERAYFFTSSNSTAKTYSRDKPAFDSRRAEPDVFDVYLSIQNPMIIDGSGKAWGKRGGQSAQALQIADAKAKGHDGIIIRKTSDTYNDNPAALADIFIAFRPEQIKSVNNRGTFDKNDPRILFSQPKTAADVTDARVAELRQQARAIAKAVEVAESDIADAAKYNEKIMRARQVAADKIAQWTKSDDLTAAVRDAKEYEAALARQATDPDASQQSRRDALRARDEAVAELATLRESLAEAKKAGEDAIRMQDRFSGAKAIDATAMAEYRAKLIEAADLAATAYEQAARIMQKRRDRAKTLRDKIKEAEDKRAAVGTATGAQQPITFSYTDKFTDDIRGNLRKLREFSQDKMLSALLVQNDIEAARGALSDSVNVYRRENLMHGRSGDQLEQLKRKHVAPLVNAMKAAKVDDAVMEDWLEATFAPERNALIAAKNPAMPDGGSGMTNAEAAAFLAGKTDGYRSGVKLTPEMTKALQSLAPKIAALRTETLTRMVASGEITQDAMDAMQESAPNYVPLRGKDGVEITTGRGVGRGVDVRGKPIKEAHGRGEGNRAENILAELIGDAERSIVQSEKNRVGKTLAKLVLENPNKELWSIEPVQTEQKTDATGQVYLAVKPNAADQDMIRFMHDGKPYHIKIANKRLREAMKGLGVDNSGVVIRFLGAIQRYFSAVLTRYNPSFIAVNALRDIAFGMTAIIAEHGAKIAIKAALNYSVAMRAIWRDERGTGKGTAMDRYAREYTAAGGKTFFAKRDSVEEIAGKLSAEFKGYGKLLRNGQVGLAWNKAISNSAMLKIVNDANDAVENAMRLAAYAALRESGKSVEQSAEYAKNITVNFNRKGQVATAANAIILFYNAAMQGAHRSINLLRNPKVMMAMGGLAGLQAVLAAYAMGADDEDEDGLTAWEKIPQWEKERNLIFPVVGVDARGKRRIRMVKWPVPYGFNVFSYAGGQLAELAMVKKPDPTKFANNMGSAVVNAFSPVKFIEGMDGFKPHIMKIFDALGANEDDLGMPIRASDDFDRFDKPRAFSGRADTPEAYKSVAKALNAVGGGDEVTPPKVFKGLLDWAPEDLEFLTGQLTGGTGRFFADTYKVGEKLFAGVDTMPTDYPILRSLVGEVDQNRATQGIYNDRAEKIEREVERVRRVLYDGREQVGGRYKLDMAAKKKADELLRSTPELDGFKITRLRNGSYLDKSGSVEIKKARGLAKSYKVAQKEIDEIRAEIRAAQARTYPSLKEKLAAIRALQEKREAAQRKFNVSFAKRVQ